MVEREGLLVRVLEGLAPGRRAPLGRWGDPSELAGAVIYFASPASSFCTGQVLMVDGGMTIAM